MNRKQDIEAAIAALEAQRPHLGDDIVELAIAPLRERLASSRIEGWTQDARRLKQVTILFMDMVDSTQMSEQLDPEDIHAIMDSALARLGEVIGRHGGRVLRYAGDGLLAVFGARTSSEDDPERAVRAGLDLLDNAHRVAVDIEQAHGLAGFAIRVGVNTGRVLLGGGVEEDNSIHGIAVNVAARMEQSAPAGGLRISRDTYRHVRGLFEVREEAPLAVKGVSGQIRSYLVLGAQPGAPRIAARGIEGIETRMVGRDAELARLQDAFRALHDDGRLQFVSVVAEAGVGKSRLLLAFEAWAAAQPNACSLYTGSCQPRTRRQSYGLLRDVLARRFQIGENDSAAVARDKFLLQVLPVFGDEEAQQVAVLGHLVGLDFSALAGMSGVLEDPQQVRNRGFHAAAQMFRRPAARDNRPALLLLDDLHWADDDSLDFLDYLLDENADVPMLVVACC